MDYKETEVAGTAWHRFSRIMVDNPYQQLPQIACVEQEVVTLPAGFFARDVGTMIFPFDPNEEFDILDPTTNQLSGQTGTAAQVYALVYSLVLHEAMKRDAPAAPPDPAPTPAPAPATGAPP